MISLLDSIVNSYLYDLPDVDYVETTYGQARSITLYGSSTGCRTDSNIVHDYGLKFHMTLSIAINEVKSRRRGRIREGLLLSRL
jgi:hypothetical protein